MRSKTAHAIAAAAQTGALYAFFGVAPAEPAISTPKLAILEFGFVDTSGEVQDQKLAHEIRLRLLSDGLRDELSARRKFGIVDVVCGDRPCASGMDAGQILHGTQSSGADYLMRGVVRKMSTLILSIQIDVTDVKNRAVVFARSFSFRGDTDEAWRHASAFIAREISTEFEGQP